MATLVSIEGIGEAYAEKLTEAGIKTTDALLKKGGTAKGRKEMASATDIPAKLILRWVNHVDLFRIKGIAGQYAELLEAAGVDTVPELAQRKADNLLQKMIAVNVEKKLLRRLPTVAQVQNWIDQAKTLPRIVTY